MLHPLTPSLLTYKPQITHTRIYILDRSGKHLASILGPVRTAWKLVDERVCDFVVLARQSASSHITRQGHLQKGSLNRFWSPNVGRYEGKSNMMAPLLQSAPSTVLYVT